MIPELNLYLVLGISFFLLLFSVRLSVALYQFQ